jgi:hypothetical protein
MGYKYVLAKTIAPLVFRVDGLYQTNVQPALLLKDGSSVDGQRVEYNNISGQNFIRDLNHDGKEVVLMEFPPVALT